MNPEQLRAIALEVAQSNYLYSTTQYEDWIGSFATRFLAAIAKKSEPVALDAIYAAWHGAGVDIAGGNWKRFVGMLPPLFTHPAIEPAPQEQKPQTTTVESGSPAQPVPVGAAPLPDDVAELVARLRGYHICTVTNNEAADMIERLARQVPPDCVEKYNELLYAVETKFPGESRHETALRYIKRGEERIVHIAAEEVKP